MRKLLGKRETSAQGQTRLGRMQVHGCSCVSMKQGFMDTLTMSSYAGLSNSTLLLMLRTIKSTGRFEVDVIHVRERKSPVLPQITHKEEAGIRCNLVLCP